MTTTNLQKMMAESEKLFGPHAIRKASEILPKRRIPTGVFSLDARLGGGLPMGCIIEFVGEPSGGKSSIALLAIANAQGLDRFTHRPLVRDGDTFIDASTGKPGTPMVATYLDAEGTWDSEWAEACGVDTERLYYAPVAYLEQAYDLVSGFIKTGEVDIIVLDSIAALAPATEVESSMEDQQMGVAARGNNKGLRKMTAEFNRLVQSNRNAPMVLLINQMREKIGVMFGDPATSPGGRGQEFFASLRVKVWPEALGKSLKNDDKEIVARTSKFKIEKNKVNGVHGDGEFTLYLRDHGPYLRGHVDDSEQVLDWATRLGTLEKSGSVIHFPDGTKHNGKAKAALALMEDRTMYDQVRADVLDRLRATTRQVNVAAETEEE